MDARRSRLLLPGLVTAAALTLSGCSGSGDGGSSGSAAGSTGSAASSAEQTSAPATTGADSSSTDGTTTAGSASSATSTGAGGKPDKASVAAGLKRYYDRQSSGTGSAGPSRLPASFDSGAYTQCIVDGVYPTATPQTLRALRDGRQGGVAAQDRSKFGQVALSCATKVMRALRSSSATAAP